MPVNEGSSAKALEALLRRGRASARVTFSGVLQARSSFPIHHTRNKLRQFGPHSSRYEENESLSRSRR